NCADYLNKKGYRAKWLGIDFNGNILEYAKRKSKDYPNIEFREVDVLLDDNLIPNCDIALFTLFMHHFNNENIEDLLKTVLSKTKIGLVVNDLQRNKMAFNLFKIVSKLFLKTKTAEHDGLVSIARGFRKSELEAISVKM